MPIANTDLQALLDSAEEQQLANVKSNRQATYDLASLLQKITLQEHVIEVEELITLTNIALASILTAQQNNTNAIAAQTPILTNINNNLNAIYSRLGTMATNQNVMITHLSNIAANTARIP